MKTRVTRVKVASLVSLGSLVLLLAFLAVGLVSAAPPNVPPGLARAAAAQERYTDALLATAGVVGTAVGLAADGQPVVKVYTKSANVHGLPTDLDGVPVEVEETGEFVAQDALPQGIGESSGTERLITVRRSLYCTVGTLGMLLTDGASNVYALSNAHVYANEGSTTYGGKVNTGVTGDRILQPGRVDMGLTACGTQNQINAAVIGNLWAYTPIVFSRTANNQVDAAIAKLSKSVENSTPNGLTPSTTIQAATIGLPVQKEGRTTHLTQSTVSAINATVLIRYDSGVARFIGQVVVGGPFSDSGDSGSLIMTVNGNHPVALLFAGSSSTTIGNPIDKVVVSFDGLSIVGTTRKLSRTGFWGPGLAVAATALIWLGGASVAGGQQRSRDGREARQAAARPLDEVLRAHADRLMAMPGVVGVAHGLCDGQPCIKVFVARKTPDLLKVIPASVEGYPVDVEETGEFRPFAPPRR